VLKIVCVYLIVFWLPLREGGYVWSTWFWHLGVLFFRRLTELKTLLECIGNMMLFSSDFFSGKGKKVSAGMMVLPTDQMKVILPVLSVDCY